MLTRLPFIILAWVLADIYFYKAVETLTANSVILWGYWLIDLLLVTGFMFVMSRARSNRSHVNLIGVLMAGTLLTFVPKVLSMPVLLVEDITRLFRHFPPRTIWVSELAMAIAAFVFISLLYGMTGGRHRYKVHRVTLKFDDLPKEFDGFTFTQLSDIHAGSFSSRRGVVIGVSLVNKQNSDMILFTGDLVINNASEMDQWIETFAKLKAPYGKYSVLGNHDYGDYTGWE